MQHLQSESEQLRIEEQQRQIAQEQGVKQLNELDSRLAALLFSSSTNSTPHRTTADNSEG